MSGSATPTTEEHGRDLILAAAQDYGWDDLQPFVASLRSTGFAGEVRFFASGLSRATVERLEAAGVAVTHPVRLRLKAGDHTFDRFDPLFWHLGRALAYLPQTRRAAVKNYLSARSRVRLARYFWYLDHLSETLGRYRNVMLADARDVVFLGNPFDFAIGDAACFFLEDDTLRIDQQIPNKTWMVDAYGPAAVVELADCPISCSGVTIGPASAVMEYLEVMVGEVVRLSLHVDLRHDQPLHNYVLHKRLVRNPQLISNGGGPVLTFAIMSDDAACRLFDSCASRVRVLHQYDRLPRLAEVVRERLSGLTAS